jgi:hypothetical protein
MAVPLLRHTEMYRKLSRGRLPMRDTMKLHSEAFSFRFSGEF